MKFTGSKGRSLTLASLFFSFLLTTASLSFGRDNFRNATQPSNNTGTGQQNIVCPDDRGGVLEFNHDQVAKWKHSTRNSFRERAHVKGEITNLFSDRNGHVHFELSIDSNEGLFTLEIIYNESFGRLPDLELGWLVEACGDYITSFAQAGPYPASPNGAILHWVHKNPSFRGHASGFLIIQGQLFGYDLSRVRPR